MTDIQGSPLVSKCSWKTSIHMPGYATYSHLATNTMPNLSLLELCASLPTAWSFWPNKHLCFCKSGVPGSEFNVGALANPKARLAYMWSDTRPHGAICVFRPLPSLAWDTLTEGEPYVLGQMVVNQAFGEKKQTNRSKPERPRFLSALIS